MKILWLIFSKHIFDCIKMNLNVFFSLHSGDNLLIFNVVKQQWSSTLCSGIFIKLECSVM